MSLAYFPSGYWDSKLRLQNISGSLSDLRSHEVLKIASAKDRDLAVDFIYLPALTSPQKLVVLISGVHGSETYAAHAVQELFFKEFLPLLDRQTTGYAIVHALNPFGFKNHQRTTENLINLNRNCSIKPQMFQMKNSRSLELSDEFIPKLKVESLTSYVKQKIEVKNSRVSISGISLDEFTKATACGQFQSPEGLEYGGQKIEPQIEKLADFLTKTMPMYAEVLAFDIHTGLGEKGRLHLLTDDNPLSLNPDLLAKILPPRSKPKNYEFTPPSAEGFYSVYGATNNLFAELARPEQKVCALTMEFGTWGHSFEAQLRSLNQFMIEHQGLCYGFADSEIKKRVSELCLDRSYPDDLMWKRQIVDAAREFFDDSFRNFEIRLKNTKSKK